MYLPVAYGDKTENNIFEISLNLLPPCYCLTVAFQSCYEWNEFCGIKNYGLYSIKWTLKFSKCLNVSIFAVLNTEEMKRANKSKRMYGYGIPGGRAFENK